MSKRKIRFFVGILVVVVLVYGVGGAVLTAMGRFLVQEDPLENSDAVVVLSTGVDYYARLTEAAALYRAGLAKKVVINGDRKSDVLRKLEAQGFEPCCLWYEDCLRILEVLGVPRQDVVPISAPDAYDTISEARAVGEPLAGMGVSRILLATSKFHTRRAYFIWAHMYPERFSIRAAPARDDPFQPDGWWKSGQQMRQLLAEYGAWLYYAWEAL